MSTFIKIFAKGQAKQITDDETMISFGLHFHAVLFNFFGTLGVVNIRLSAQFYSDMSNFIVIYMLTQVDMNIRKIKYFWFSLGGSYMFFAV